MPEPTADTDRPPETVLVAYDFSPSADKAVALAASLADAFDRRLMVLHVVHDPAQAPGFYLASVDEKAAKRAKKAAKKAEKKAAKRSEEGVRDRAKGLRKRARTMTSAADAMLAQVVVDLRDQLPDSEALQGCVRRLAVGTPARRIVDVAREENAVHIVMGSRGRGALSGMLLGSTAVRVVHLTRIPVTLVRAEKPGDQGPR